MMYILYIDESGVTELNAQGDHFVLLGVAIPADEWKEIDRKISEIKTKYRLKDTEIHTGWMARRYVEQEKHQDFKSLSDQQRREWVEKERKDFIKLAVATKTNSQVKNIVKQHRKTNCYIHMTFDERMDCLKDIAEELNNCQSMRMFAEVVDKRICGLDRDEIFENSFTQVISRFETFLGNRGNFIGKDLTGIVVQDNNELMNKRLTKLMRKFHNKGTTWRNIDRIVETPLFVDSELTVMVQLADLCAWATRRFFDSYDHRRIFETIYPRFDRSGENVVGIRHFTGPNHCECKVCKDHGR